MSKKRGNQKPPANPDAGKVEPVVDAAEPVEIIESTAEKAVEAVEKVEQAVITDAPAKTDAKMAEEVSKPVDKQNNADKPAAEHKSGTEKKGGSKAPAAPVVRAMPAQEKPKGGRGLASAAIVLSLLSGVGAYWVWTQLEGVKSAQSGQVADFDNRLNTAIAKATSESKASIAEFGESLGSQTSALESQQGVVEGIGKQIGELSQTVSKLGENQQASATMLASRVENLQLAQRGIVDSVDAAITAAAKGDINALTLSEVQYLLKMSDHKLKLQRDVPAAIEALSLAELRLGAVNEFAFSSVQSMVQENVAALRGVQLPDMSGVMEQMSAVQAQIAGLPLRIDVQVDNLKEKVNPNVGEGVTELVNAESEASWWDRASGSAMAGLKDVVSIRNQRTSGPPLIAVEEEYFLRQNLRLELEAARLAMLRDDAVVYQEALNRARGWVNDYFDGRADATTKLLGDIEALAKVQMNPYIPDMSGTIKAFDEVMSKRQPVRSMTPGVKAAAAPAEEVQK